MQTIGSALERHNGLGPGFDFLRIALALLVVLSHSYQVSYGIEDGGVLAQGFCAPFLAAILPMFFGLSGFLVMGSSFRTRNTGTFLAYRALRLVPALAVEVTLSALILGPLLTTVPLREYFSDPRVLEYFGNIIGRVRYFLPGVFEDLPRAGVVNANLWTLHAELICYFLMTCGMLTRLAYERVVVTVLWVLLTIAMTTFNVFTHVYELKGGIYSGHVLVYSFATGVLAYHWRHAIPCSDRLALIAAGVAFVLLKLPYTAFVAHLPLIYLTVWIGTKRLPSYGGDYSYGVYLYSYPIQQMLMSISPSLHEWWIIFPLSAALSLLVAAVSWIWIERPALSLKRYVHILRPRPT
ncbi:acyltransferase family protein [Afipia sp. TerB]